MLGLFGKNRREQHEADKKAYKALMYFPFKHWSQKCLALYFPAEETRRATLPNRGDLIQSIHSARKNGIDLDFLKERKA